MNFEILNNSSTDFSYEVIKSSSNANLGANVS